MIAASIPSDIGQAHLGFTDFSAIALYMAAVAGIAIWSKMTEKGGGESEYFLAGRRMNWIVVSVAMFAALFSSISFVAVPSEIYQHGMGLFLVSLLIPFTAPLGVKLFLRFFFHHPTLTAYEYLENRFDLGTRLIGSGLFFTVRVFYAAVVYYSAAVLLGTLTGWSGMGIILAIGIFTTVYTTFGGMKAVMYTDALQAIVLVLGLCAIAWRIMATTNTTLWDLYTYASAQGRGFEVLVSPAFWQLDLHTRFNGWLLLIVLITAPMITLSSDQLVIQRLLTSKNYREARRATYTNYWLNIPLGLPSFLIGWGLLHFYNRFPQKVPVGLSPDNLMAFFIGTELPAPLPGLLVAALLAATMSTTSSVANSLATVVFHDFFLRLGWIKPGSKKEPQLCRILSFSAGVLAMAFSCVLLRAGETVTTTIMETAGLWCSLTSIIFAAFLIGVTVPWVSAHAMKWGLAIGGILTRGLPLICYYPVPVAERISFAWLWIPGFLVAITLPLLLSKFWPHQKSVDKLTLWTLGEETTASPAKSSS